MTVSFDVKSRSGKPRVCIVTNAPISQNPRAVKEADALSANGYDVTVIFAQHADWTRDDDQHLVGRALWRGVAIKAWPGRVVPRARGAVVRARTALFRTIAEFSSVAPIAELAYSRFCVEQLWAALGTRADLYIGHNPPSLPIVAWAARLTGAKYGFDFEDFYPGERPHIAKPSLADRLCDVVLNRYLSRASHITAASWGIAEAVAKTYRVPKPLTLLNVFPWIDRAALARDRVPASSGRGLSLYWFSQIVGRDRGLEDAVAAVGQAATHAVLHIRGAATAEMKSELLDLARRSGAETKVIFHDPVPSSGVLASCAEHDVGLSLEVPLSINRDICITNKLFMYMLAGLAVIASRTQGQRDVLAAVPAAGFLYEPGNIAELASIIDRLGSDRELLRRTRASALEAARSRWNWELESRVLIEAVDAALSVPRRQLVLS